MYYRILYNPKQKHLINNLVFILYNNLNIIDIDINEANTQKFKIKYNNKKIFVWIQKIGKYEVWYNSKLPYDIRNNNYNVSEIIDYIIKEQIPEESNPVSMDDVHHPCEIELMSSKTPEFVYITLLENENPKFCEYQFEGYFVLNHNSNQNINITKKMFFLD